MSTREAPTRGEGFVAYVLSALTTLLWVGCVLPAGHVATAGAGPDAATPVHREAILLIPALLLLIAVPVGCTLARRSAGLRAVLAGMDGFVVLYVGLAMLGEGLVRDGATMTAAALLLGLAALSFVEVLRLVRPEGQPDRATALSGARLAISLLVLFLPLHILRQPHIERASLLAPFLFVAVSAGGARMAQEMRGLRRTTALLQLLMSLHVLVTLRYTIYRTSPTLETVNVVGEITLGLATAVAVTAALQLALLARRLPPREASDGPDALPATAIR